MRDPEGFSSPSPGLGACLQEHVLLCEKGRAVDADPDAKEEYGNSFGAIVEEGEQNKVDSYPSQTLTAKDLSEWRLEAYCQPMNTGRAASSLDQ